MKKAITIIIAMVFAIATIAVASACTVSSKPAISLSPTEGFATTTVTGTGFSAGKTITIAYDGISQPTVPTNIQADSSGSFTAIISIPDELAVGPHTISATDNKGTTGSAVYTVVDMKGQQGKQGPQGESGQNGAAFNSTGNIFVYNGTNGINGLNGADFNATGNVLVYNGTNGSNGLNGLNGKDGTNGVNGINGTNGANGKNGKDGTDGSNGTPGVGGKTVYVDPPQNSLLEYILILAAALIALAATLVACRHKWKTKTA